MRTHNQPKLGEMTRTEQFDNKPNQYAITFDKGEILQSYDSIIVVRRYKDNQIFIGQNWNYSRTTAKYRNMYLGETTAETQAKIDSGEYKMLNN